ncbi:hypothetical protein AWC38_SpisGene11416 [Stylophora pistillata]|uniref:Uncharacterized protein n=1 Tax=Stylophora pistillata TaxID=50429 RepID=A0A2B4S278_STYPI|nr:hypothetical protein AWC38_SpisGene11416 [Stylophora pistillata]
MVWIVPPAPSKNSRGVCIMGVVNAFPTEPDTPLPPPDHTMEALYQAILQKTKSLRVMGYTVVEMRECEWKSKSVTGLFASYVNTWLKIKQESGRFPARTRDEEDQLNMPHKRSEYVDKYQEREGIALDPTLIAKNPGRKMTAKLKLNSFWGKFEERMNKCKVTQLTQAHELFALLNNPKSLLSDSEASSKGVGPHPNEMAKTLESRLYVGPVYMMSGDPRDFLERYCFKVDFQNGLVSFPSSPSPFEGVPIDSDDDLKGKAFVSSAHASHTFIVPPQSEIRVPGNLDLPPELGLADENGIGGIITPKSDLCHRYSIFGASELVSVAKDGTISVRLINPSFEPVKIYRRTRLAVGGFSELVAASEELGCDGLPFNAPERISEQALSCSLDGRVL